MFSQDDINDLIDITFSVATVIFIGYSVYGWILIVELASSAVK